MTNHCMTTQEGVAIDDCGRDLKSVLLVDDEQSFLFSLLRQVENMNNGLNVYTAANGMQARAILNTVPTEHLLAL